MKVSFATGLGSVALLSAFALGGTCAIGADKSQSAPTAESSSDIRIRYADLDLSKPDDVRRLYGRIVRAARLVCDSVSSFGGNLSRVQNCVRKTVADTVKQIDKPALNAYYAKNNLP